MASSRNSPGCLASAKKASKNPTFHQKNPQSRHEASIGGGVYFFGGKSLTLGIQSPSENGNGA